MSKTMKCQIKYLTSKAHNDKITKNERRNGKSFGNKEPYMKEKYIWKKRITAIMVIIWMIIIFAFSAQPAQQSSKTSHSVSYKIAEWQNRLFRHGKTEQLLSKQAESMQLIIRKSAHMGEYAFLAALLFLHFNCYPLKRQQILLLALGITTGYATSDEIHQLFVPGRVGRLSDVCIDSLGGILGLILCLIIFRLLNRRKNNMQL